MLLCENFVNKEAIARWIEASGKRSLLVIFGQILKKFNKRDLQALRQLVQRGKRRRRGLGAFQLLEILIVDTSPLSQSLLGQAFGLPQFLKSMGKAYVNGVHCLKIRGLVYIKHRIYTVSFSTDLFLAEYLCFFIYYVFAA